MAECIDGTTGYHGCLMCQKNCYTILKMPKAITIFKLVAIERGRAHFKAGTDSFEMSRTSPDGKDFEGVTALWPLDIFKNVSIFLAHKASGVASGPPPYNKLPYMISFRYSTHPKMYLGPPNSAMAQQLRVWFIWFFVCM